MMLRFSHTLILRVFNSFGCPYASNEKKTGKVVLASDACTRDTFRGDIAMNITAQAFDYLDAPPGFIKGAWNAVQSIGFKKKT